MANNTGYDDPELSTLIDRQHGVLTAAQAKDGGVPPETLRRRVQRGLWQRLVPAVYVLQGGPPSRLQWLIAAQLYAGESAVLTGRAAMAVHGVRFPEDGIGEPDGFGVLGEHCAARHRLDALVPHRMRRQNVAHVRIIRTSRVPEARRVGVLRIAPLARCVVDGCLAAVEDREPESIDAMVTAALENGVQLAELEYELRKASRKYSAAVRAELRKSRAHMRVSASQRFLARLGKSGPFGAQPDVAIYVGQRRVARAVAVWPTRAVVVTVDADPLQVSTLTTLGFAVIHATSEQLTQNANGVLRQLRGTLRDRPEATLSPGVSLLPLASMRERELARA